LGRKRQKGKSRFNISNELRQIKNCVTSNGIWKKLKELYESKGPARKATLLKQLIMSKMNEGETMKNHLNNFFNIIDKLEEMELKIVDDLVTILLLYSIPDMKSSGSQ
jgi:hypothetical protein